MTRISHLACHLKKTKHKPGRKSGATSKEAWQRAGRMRRPVRPTISSSTLPAKAKPLDYWSPSRTRLALHPPHHFNPSPRKAQRANAPSSDPPLPQPHHHDAAAAFFADVGRGARRRRQPGLGVHDARGGAHVEGALVHLPAAGVPVPERTQVRPGLQPLQLARMARP
jgi:hypothetical protein